MSSIKNWYVTIVSFLDLLQKLSLCELPIDDNVEHQYMSYDSWFKLNRKIHDILGKR